MQKNLTTIPIYDIIHITKEQTAMKLGWSDERGEPLAWVCLGCLQEAARSLETVIDNDI